MFGLLRAHRKTPHYCGTCKALGRRYGARARVLLNHDTVFLGELMSALEGDGDPRVGAAPLMATGNCLRLPRSAEDVPPAMRYAAAATVVLAEHSIADHAADLGGRRWKWLAQVYATPFREAAADLARWGFPIDQLRAVLATQPAREAFPRGATPAERIDWFAEPTAAATGLFFEHAAHRVGRPGEVEKMRALGRTFGRLAYVLDAFEDFDRDALRHSFNALEAAQAGRDWGRDEVRRVAREMSVLLGALPIAAATAQALALRLRHNVTAALGEPCVARAHAFVPILAVTGAAPVFAVREHPGAAGTGGACAHSIKERCGGWCCAADCLSGCCESCCDSCGDSCCDSCCNC